jgi:cytochrome c oxidase assembly protein subunit 15
VLVIVQVLSLAVRALRRPGYRVHGALLAAALCLQLALGIGNVLGGLPLAVATAHNFGAALLLAVLIGLLARLTPLPAGLAPARAAP